MVLAALVVSLLLPIQFSFRVGPVIEESANMDLAALQNGKALSPYSRAPVPSCGFVSEASRFSFLIEIALCQFGVSGP